MSYDLAVWEGAQPGDDVEAGGVYEQLYEEYMEGGEFGPTPRILAYAAALAERWAAHAWRQNLWLGLAAR
ncbi:hypothetical protein [Micromonospora sp. NPDC002717]|uniref:hypothetical protein n=1 Tax=Micromonospora sp. NPDC002717 TaxID=3154424 RepID=UPI0033281E88